MKFVNKSTLILFLLLTTFKTHCMEEGTPEGSRQDTDVRIMAIAQEVQQPKKSLKQKISNFFSWCWNSPSFNPYSDNQTQGAENINIRETHERQSTINKAIEQNLAKNEVLNQAERLNFNDLLKRAAGTQDTEEGEDEDEEDDDLPTDYVNSQENNVLANENIIQIFTKLLDGIAEHIDSPNQASPHVPHELKAFLKEVLVTLPAQRIHSQTEPLPQSEHAKFLIEHIKNSLQEKKNQLAQELAGLSKEQSQLHRHLQHKREDHGAIINLIVRNKHNINLTIKRFIIFLILDFGLARAMDLIVGGMPLFFVTSNIFTLLGFAARLPGNLYQHVKTFDLNNLWKPMAKWPKNKIPTPTTNTATPCTQCKPLKIFSDCVECIKRVISGKDASGFEWVLNSKDVTRKLTPTDLTNFVKKTHTGLVKSIAQCIKKCPKSLL